MKEFISITLGITAITIVGMALVMSVRSMREKEYVSPLVSFSESGPTRGVPEASESAHPNSDAEIDERHALCFIAHLQGLSPTDDHCKQHGIDYDENGDFWKI